MTDLDKIRGELKRGRAYEPGKPVHLDLVLQVVADLAFRFGTDAAYVLELFEQIASDTGVDHDPGAVTPEVILKTLFDTLAPYQSGTATNPPPIEYVSARLPATEDVQVNDLIREFAIQECGWPIGTYVGLGSRFELTYEVQDRRAYCLNAGPDTYLIPRYTEALCMHIEKRDRAFANDEDKPDMFQRFAKAIKEGKIMIPPPRFGKKHVLDSLAGKRGSMIVCDDVIDESGSTPKERMEVAQRFHEAMAKIQEAKKEIEAFSRDHPDREARCRGPPGDRVHR